MAHLRSSGVVGPASRGTPRGGANAPPPPSPLRGVGSAVSEGFPQDSLGVPCPWRAVHPSTNSGAPGLRPGPFLSFATAYWILNLGYMHECPLWMSPRDQRLAGQPGGKDPARSGPRHSPEEEEEEDLINHHEDVGGEAAPCGSTMCHSTHMRLAIARFGHVECRSRSAFAPPQHALQGAASSVHTACLTACA
jgi:hypothetical protein